MILGCYNLLTVNLKFEQDVLMDPDTSYGLGTSFARFKIRCNNFVSNLNLRDLLTAAITH